MSGGLIGQAIAQYRRAVDLLESDHLGAMIRNLILAQEACLNAADLEHSEVVGLINEVRADLESRQAEIMGIIHLLTSRISRLEEGA